MKGFGIGVAVVIGIVVLVVGIYAIRYATADVRGKVDAREKIKSGDSRIAAYEHFFNLCSSVQGDEYSLDSLYPQLGAAETVEERERLRISVAGLQANRSRSIVQYNVDARKSYTQGQFRASDLPYQLPVGLYDPKEGVHTSCEA